MPWVHLSPVMPAGATSAAQRCGTASDDDTLGSVLPTHDGQEDFGIPGVLILLQFRRSDEASVPVSADEEWDKIGCRAGILDSGRV